MVATQANGKTDVMVPLWSMIDEAYVAASNMKASSEERSRRRDDHLEQSSKDIITPSATGTLLVRIRSILLAELLTTSHSTSTHSCYLRTVRMALNGDTHLLRLEASDSDKARQRSTHDRDCAQGKIPTERMDYVMTRLAEEDFEDCFQHLAC
ncbi:hypothetical protein BD626DRAFT_489296 [Schizophyllum amplum]|uniref:Uncharacterized protein n=1 Tax=Schizophyllum amplum TaxID=97359 RepID=A0A550CLC7_9AGAR|nr:hypothetical protein BD626DRAFT_489296 [Auriculariopsis ampla]